MFYHVSKDLSQVISVFEPRIPRSENRMDGENDSIPRICLAKSLEDCLSAMPEGGYALEDSEEPHYIRLYLFDEEQIQPENIMSSTELYFSGYVQDAWVTGEYWVVEQSLVPTRILDIQINEIEVIDAPYVSPEAFNAAFLKAGDPEEILDELEENSTESVARVTKLEYEIVAEKELSYLF